ncbi:hypothetical protein H2200_003625 [Cladophialophora chaetospira]|uniref:Protein kinase domain-containing protein n=1 Tax=Cladophialophora chaetospira TaxID=386627 RepID=A0AA38XEJ5_9EURO|nr:hypothetical protein H2200_003625 [Cladophialophora chaetospira]
MSSPLYAVYFPELTDPSAPGYLLIRNLGSGVEGTVDLVRRVSDGERFARKKTVPMLPAHEQYHSSEVFFHRQHPLIPALNSSTECKVLADWHPEVDKVKSTVMLSKFCNGGTLADFSDEFALGRRPITELTESILWHVFAAQLTTVMFLHGCNPSLGYTDSHMSNIFLDFPDGSKFPTFFTGDLGHVNPLNPGIWEPTEPGQPRKIKSAESLVPPCEYRESIRCLSDDLGYISANLSHLATFLPTEGPDDPGAYDEDELPNDWSDEFEDCLGFLCEIISHLQLPMPESERQAFRQKYGIHVNPQPCDIREYNRLSELKERVDRHAKESRANDPANTDFSWAKNQVTTPAVWNTPDELLYDCKRTNVAGPFKMAKVDPLSFKVMEIDETEYGICNPEQLEDGMALLAAGPFPPEHFKPDPLKVVPDYPWFEFETVNLQDNNGWNAMFEAEQSLYRELFADVQDGPLWIEAQKLLHQQQSAWNGY